MGTGYSKCGEDVHEMFGELIQKYRSDLVDCGATIELLFAFNDKGHALKARGHRILGKCKINNLLDRAQDKSDVTIILDLEFWKIASERRRIALLHHELSHIEIYDNENGTDDLARPVLKSRPGDWDFDGFVKLAKLYGEDSLERINLEIVQQHLDQMEMFRDEDKDEEEPDDDSDEDWDDDEEEEEEEEEEEDDDDEPEDKSTITISADKFHEAAESASKPRRKAKA